MAKMDISQMQYKSEFALEFMAKGREEGRKEGRVEGREEEARSFVLKLLSSRYGRLSQAQLARVRTASRRQREAIAMRLLTAKTLEDALGPVGVRSRTARPVHRSEPAAPRKTKSRAR